MNANEQQEQQPLSPNDDEKKTSNLLWRTVTRLRDGWAGEAHRAMRSSRVYQFTILTITVFAVFGDDIRLAALPVEADETMQVFFYLVLAMFILDIVLSSLLEEGYVSKGVLFFLDVVATGSMVVQPVVEQHTNTGTHLVIGRLARVVRLLRVLRVTRFAVVTSDMAVGKAQKKRFEATQGHTLSHTVAVMAEVMPTHMRLRFRQGHADPNAGPRKAHFGDPFGMVWGRPSPTHNRRIDSHLSKDTDRPQSVAQFATTTTSKPVAVPLGRSVSSGDVVARMQQNASQQQQQHSRKPRGLSQRSVSLEWAPRKSSQSGANSSVESGTGFRGSVSSLPAVAVKRFSMATVADDEANVESEGETSALSHSSPDLNSTENKDTFCDDDDFATSNSSKQVDESEMTGGVTTANAQVPLLATDFDKKGKPPGQLGRHASWRRSNAVDLEKLPQHTSPGVFRTARTHRGDDDDDNGPDLFTDDLLDDTVRPTSIGTLLVATTTENIVLLILVLVVGVSFLELTIPDRSALTGLRLLSDSFPFFNETGCFEPPHAAITDVCVETPCCDQWSLLLHQYANTLEHHGVSPKVIHVGVSGRTFFSMATRRLRGVERDSYSVDESWSVVDNSSFVRTNALWAIGQAVCITFIVAIFPYLLSRDVLSFVVTPLEILYDRIQVVATNPFSHLQEQALENSRSHEVHMVTESLTRLTKLLQVSLGHAGADVIGRNLVAGSFSALHGGRRVNAVFGFCDIRSFTSLTEVLQEDCVSFVNSVARVLATNLTETKGSVNKNVGDAFLMTWKFAGPINRKPNATAVLKRRKTSTVAARRSQDTRTERRRKDSHLHNNYQQQQQRNDESPPRPGVKKNRGINISKGNGPFVDALAAENQDSIGVAHVMSHSVCECAENALSGCLAMIHDIRKSPEVQSFAVCMRSRLEQEFTINLGFGLHLGWAIEGAVGSEHKIDATYMSPHVTMSMRLEELTKMYGVELLMSHWFCNELTSETKHHCRRVDRVSNNISSEPMTLLVYVEGSDSENVVHDTERYFKPYLAGMWSECRDCLIEFRKNYRDDGPSKAIWDFIETHNFKAPLSWKGYREYLPPQQVLHNEDLWTPRSVRSFHD